jgi:hypothetical protein
LPDTRSKQLKTASKLALSGTNHFMGCQQSGSWPETLVLYRQRTSATISVSLDLRSSRSIQPFDGSRFVRGGRYGISIDFGLEVVEKQSICGAIFESKFIDPA